MSTRFPDDDRNAKAADELERLASTDIATVDPAIWAALAVHAGTPQLRDAVNDCSRELEFKFSARDLNEFIAVVRSKLSNSIH